MNYQEIIKKNCTRLYRIPKKYKYLNLLFKDEELRKLYFSMMQYIKDKKLYRLNGKISFHLSSNDLKNIRGRGSASTSNEYMNFLCAMGLIRKHTQNHENLTHINESFLQDKPKTIRPINTFYFYSLSAEKLEEIEQRCFLLSSNNIKKSNISKDKLLLNGLNELAEEVYSETESALTWKDKSYSKIIAYLTAECNNNGYTTKSKLYENVIINKNSNRPAVDKVLKQYRSALLEQFNYKRPTQQEKKLFNLSSDKWIYTLKL